MPRKNSPPKYRLHKARNCGVVTIDGKNHYLGRYGSPESHEKYSRLIAEWSHRSVACEARRLPLPPEPKEFTINELILRYLDHAEGYYRKHGKPSDEFVNIRCSLRPVKQLYGRTVAAEFNPRSLKVVRDAMIESGLARNTINNRVSRIRRMFRWATEEELISGGVYHGLGAVAGLKAGRTNARETAPVEPVPEEIVFATIDKLNPVVAAMVQVQLLTGMRPQDVRNLRTCDLDQTRDVWVYTCWTHKTEHHGHTRRVAIGPRAQLHLEPFLKPTNPEVFVFSPKDAAEARRKMRRNGSPRTTNRSGHKKKRLEALKRPPRDQYTTASYRRAIARAAERAGVADWHPHQLRHTCATKVRQRFGLDSATIVLGHRHGVTTEIYAEADFNRAIEVMREMG